MDHIQHHMDRYSPLVTALEQLAQAQREQAMATVFAAAYTASNGITPISKALDAMEHFKRNR